MSYNVEVSNYKDNIYRVNIHKDPMNKYMVKVEENLSKFGRSLSIKHQGDTYKRLKSIMYLVVEDPGIVDILGILVSKFSHLSDEKTFIPPKFHLKLANSIRTC